MDGHDCNELQLKKLGNSSLVAGFLIYPKNRLQSVLLSRMHLI